MTRTMLAVNIGGRSALRGGPPPIGPYRFAMGDDDAVRRHYEDIREEHRLATGLGQLELLRTREVLRRYLPPAPARVLDVGGATGVHAAWLAEDGYEVHVVDLTARHIEKVLSDLGSLGVTAEQGDARHLNHSDHSFDVVLLLGPLYHLTDEADRLQALREAGRVVRRGGLVAVAAINRFASLLDGLAQGFLFDPEFARIVDQDLADGQHRNPSDRREWFTTAYFHHPDGLRRELQSAGLSVVDLVGVEGLAGWLDHLTDRWNTDAGKTVILEASRVIESEPSLLGLSAHLLAVARAPA
jgi:SAM-dependent methyltransferase